MVAHHPFFSLTGKIPRSIMYCLSFCPLLSLSLTFSTYSNCFRFLLLTKVVDKVTCIPPVDKSNKRWPAFYPPHTTKDT